MDKEDDSDGLILVINAPTLQEISTFHIAGELFRRNWITHELTPSRDRLKCLLGDKLSIISSILGQMKLPDRIREMIMAQMYSMDVKLGRWTWSEENTCFAIGSRDQYAFVYFPLSYDHIVWKHDNFAMNVERTVRNMLKSDEFNALQKFKLACAYCFEDEIDEMWTSVSSIWEPDIISLIGNRYVRYWIEKKMVGGVPRNSQDDVFVIQLLSESNLSAYEYYWNRLSSQHQVQVILHFIRCNITFPFEYLFPKLSLLQWIQLVNENPDNVMFHLIRNYYTDDRKKDSVLQVWAHIQDMMDDDVFKLMIRICCEHSCQIDEICLHRQIWNNAPDHLKESFLKELFDIRCHALLDAAKVPAFFNTDLRSVDFHLKSIYFQKLSMSIMRYYSYSDFEKLISWCFTESEIIGFKASLLADVERGFRDQPAEFSDRSRLLGLLTATGINRL